MSASVGPATETISYSGFGYGTVYFPSGITLGTGGVMTFRGGNRADVPAFEVSATIPGLAVITSSVTETDGGVAVIDTSRDLAVTWLPISLGKINFTLNAGTNDVGSVAISIACTFEGTSGAGVVPHVLLSPLKEMAGTSPPSARLYSELETTTVVGGLTIVSQSYQNPPATDHASFNVTLR